MIKLWILAALGIAYGSLFPFDFGKDPPTEGLAAHLVEALRARPSRGDLLSNVVLYLPLGLLGTLALGPRLTRGAAFTLVAAAGTAWSAAIEGGQLLLVDRTTSPYDLGANALGTAVGAAAGLLLGPGRGALADRLGVRDRFALLVTAAWVAYRLVPFVPALDLQRMRDALQALAPPADFDLPACLRHTVAWLVVGLALRSAFAAPPSRWTLPILGFAAAGLPLFIAGRSLRPEEFVAVAAASVTWAVVTPGRRATLLVLLLHLAVIALGQLGPFNFGGGGRRFSWLPFGGFITGSLEVGVQAVFEKFFLCGAALWLAVSLGAGLWWPTAGLAIALLATEAAQTRLPGRTPEITDPLLALVSGAVLAALPPAAGPAACAAAARRLGDSTDSRRFNT